MVIWLVRPRVPTTVQPLATPMPAPNITSLRKCRLSTRRDVATYVAAARDGHHARYPKWRSRTEAAANAVAEWPEGNAQHSPVGRSRRTDSLIPATSACDRI